MSYKENFLIICFFSSIFILGWSISKDYGVTLDDYFYYINGENTYVYIKNKILTIFNKDIDLLENKLLLKDYYPIIYELLLIFITKLFNIDEINEIYFIAHRLNFFIFFISLYIFFRLIKRIFNNLGLSLLSVCFFVLSPRIYAESFYNSRDIFFLSMFIFYINFIFNFLSNKNLINTFFLSLFTALMVNTKILGYIPVGIFCILYIYNYVNTKKKLLEEKKIIIFFSFLTFLFIYITWPLLWDNPIRNLYYALSNIFKLHESVIVINYYLGQYLPSDVMPWHYRIVWFLITTPVIILFLFLFGLISIIKKKFKLLSYSLDDKFHFNNKDFIEILLLLTFFFSFLLAIEFNKSPFGGWRHLYYLYPITIYFSIYFLNLLIKKKIIYYNIIFIFIFLNLSYNFYWSSKNHPHQYVFFNFIAKNYASKNFDLDWWGISHKSALEYILKENKKDKIKVNAIGFTSLDNSYLYLNAKNKKRIVISDFDEADYIIDNKMKRLREKYKVNNDNLKLVHKIVVNDQIISAIYEKKINR